MIKKLLSAAVLISAVSSLPVAAAGTAAAPSAASPGPVPIQAFFRRPLYTDVQISPDGKYLALVGPVKDDETQTQLDFVDLVTRQVKAHYVLKNQQQVLHLWWFAPDRIVFSTIVKTGSFDWPFLTGLLWQANIDGNHVEQVGGGTVLDVPRDHPGHVIFGGWDGAAVRDLSKFRGMGAFNRELNSPNNTWVTVDNSENFRLAQGYSIKNAEPTFFYHVPGTKTLDWINISDFVKDEERYTPFGPVRFTADDRQFYYKGKTQAGTLGLYLVDTDGLKKTLLYNDPDFDIDYQFSSTEWLRSVDGKNLVAFQYQAERPQWIVVKPDAPEAAWLAELQRSFPGEAVRITSTTWDGAKAIVFVYGDTDPGQYYLFDTKTNRAEFLFATRPEINPDDMAEMRPVTFKARDGLTIHGYLTVPKGAGKGLPLIVHPHGGPFNIRDEWGFDPEVQFLAYHGFAVLQVEYRGSGGYGAAFQEAGYRQWGGKMQDDLTDATRWAIDQGIADPKRICIYGASYGGYAALEGVVKEPDLYKCAIGYAGVYDLVKIRHEAGYIQGQILKPFMLTTLGDDEDTLNQYSPYLHVDKIKANLFLAHGGKDYTADPSHVDELRDALHKAGKPFDWVYYPREGHGFYALDHQVDVYTKMLAFLERNIGPGTTAP